MQNTISLLLAHLPIYADKKSKMFLLQPYLAET